MCVSTEIILLFFLISFFVYTMPIVLVNFSRTLKGKILLLLLTIVMTLHNRTAGILMVMLFIFLAEFNYEINNGILYEGFTGADVEKEILAKKKNVTEQMETMNMLKPKNTRDIDNARDIDNTRDI